jgi:hypothetical protein
MKKHSLLFEKRVSSGAVQDTKIRDMKYGFDMFLFSSASTFAIKALYGI